MKILLTLSFIFLSLACVDKTIGNNSEQSTSKQTKMDINPDTFDTTLTPFTDISYKLVLLMFNTKGENETINNSTLTYSRHFNNNIKIYFADSLYCKYPSIENKDFNGDGINDIMFFNSTGARANPTYHLYLVDSFHYKLNRINGFEDIQNPDFDSENNIISGIGLAGMNYYKFYRINDQNKLINLGHSFEADPSDTEKYSRAVQQILEENKQ